MSHALLDGAAVWLNRHIAESASAVRVLEQLDGRSFRIEVLGLGIDWRLVVESGRLHVTAGEDGPASATVRGTPLDLLRLLGPDMASRIHGSNVSLTGQIHVAEQFAELLRLAMPDAEEALAGWIGDIAAHRVGRVASGAGAWAARAFQALRQDAAEFLTEEHRSVPSRYEADAFFAAVERLRDDVERAAERVHRLAHRAEARAAPRAEAK